MTIIRSTSPADTPPAPARAGTSRPTLLITVLCLSGIMASLVQTIIVPIIPQLPTILSATPTDASWAVTATLLAGAIATPIAGRLGDMFGKRRILVISLLALSAGSAICALSNSLIPMTSGRALQGLAMGIIPLGISIMRDELPAERFSSSIAIMSATMGIGGAIGMPVTALIAEHADWHIAFAAIAVLALVALACVLAVVPESPARSGGSFDFLGALGLGLALSALLVPITKSGQWGWGDRSTIGLLCVAAAIFLVWGWYQLRARNPLVNLRLSARRQVLFTNLASSAVGFGMFSMALIPTQLMMAPASTGYGLGLSMTETALLLAPGGLMMLLFSPVSGRMIDSLGPRVTLVVGAGIIGLGYLIVLAVPMSIWQITAANLVVSIGIGIAYASMPSLIMAAVPSTETAAANGLNSLMRSIGTSASSAVISAVLAGMTITVGVAAVPTVGAFRAAAAISLAASVCAIALTLFVPKRNGDH